MYYPKHVLFNDGVKDITVDMAIEALDYMISQISLKNPIFNDYKKAIMVLKSLKMILNNNIPPKLSKEDLKTAVDVIEEVKNSFASSEKEKQYNAEMAIRCKMVIEINYRWFTMLALNKINSQKFNNFSLTLGVIKSKL